MKDFIIPVLIMVVSIWLWKFKLEAFIKRILNKHFEKESKKVKAVFVDPR